MGFQESIQQFNSMCDELTQLKNNMSLCVKDMIIDLTKERDNYIELKRNIIITETPIDDDNYVIYALELEEETNNIIVHIKNEYYETTMSFDDLTLNDILTLGYGLIWQFDFLS